MKKIIEFKTLNAISQIKIDSAPSLLMTVNMLFAS